MGAGRFIAARRKALGALLATAGALLLVAAPDASAATEFGSTCVASRLTSPGPASLIVQSSQAGAPVQTSSPGVITRWRVATSAEIPSRVERLNVLKFAGAEWEGIAESPPEPVVSGQVNEFEARIPVPAGVSFGAFSEAGVPYCEAGEGNVFSYFGGDIAPGGHRSSSGGNPDSLVALAVTVEPDADGDGFGDETQDKCPANAATQGPCPIAGPPAPPSSVSLSLGSLRLEGNTVAARLSANAAVQVTVTGSIKGKPLLGSTTVSLSAGGSARAYLRLPKTVREKVANLPARQHLIVVIDAAGGGASAEAELAIPGRKKHHRHPHRSRG